MYYLVSKKLVDTDRCASTDGVTIEIHNRPMRHVNGDEICDSGWCGTTKHYEAIYAYGEYPTLEGAREAITEIFGNVRGEDDLGYTFEPEDEWVVEVYKPGSYKPLSPEATFQLMAERPNEITAHTTDSELEEILNDTIADLHFRRDLDPDHGAVLDYLYGRRQEERDQLKEQ